MHVNKLYRWGLKALRTIWLMEVPSSVEVIRKEKDDEK